MATPVIMPRQGQSVESCIIGKWHKQKGDKVALGDLLFTYETDKAVFDEEAKAEGVLLDVFFEEGDDVPCLTNVCVIGAEGESAAEFNRSGASPSAPDGASLSTPSVTDVTPSNSQPSILNSQLESPNCQLSTVNCQLKISPRARGLAEKSGADIFTAPATGPNGRVIERDIQAQIDAGRLATPAAVDAYTGQAVTGTGIGGRITAADLSAATGSQPQNDSPFSVFHSQLTGGEAEFVEIPNSNIRKVIAKAMHASISQMAQLTLNSSFDMTAVNAFRKKVKGVAGTLGLPNITINDIVLYAASRVLPRHELVNAHFFDDKTVVFRRAHIGMAVDTPRGLMVPTIFNADQCTLPELSKAAKAAAEAAQSGTISPDALRGGTFTVTNLGTLGIESFTPVINPPQTCILGVNTIETRVKVIGGEIKPYSAMTLSLTFDHRALDGAPAARFLKDLIDLLENFNVTT